MHLWKDRTLPGSHVTTNIDIFHRISRKEESRDCA